MAPLVHGTVGLSQSSQSRPDLHSVSFIVMLHDVHAVVSIFLTQPGTGSHGI